MVSYDLLEALQPVSDAMISDDDEKQRIKEEEEAVKTRSIAAKVSTVLATDTEKSAKARRALENAKRLEKVVEDDVVEESTKRVRKRKRAKPRPYIGPDGSEELMAGNAPVMVKNGGWTVDTLREYCMALVNELKTTLTTLIEANDRRYEQRFKDSQTAVDAALTAARTAVDAALSAAKEAVQKAETASEKRFEGVNEFRSTLSDQQRTLIPRVEAELRMNTNDARLTKLEALVNERIARTSGGKESWALIVGGMMAVIGIITFIAKFIIK